MTIGDLRKRLRFWKRLLNLEDWRIRLIAATKEDLADCHADCVTRCDHGMATIRVNPDSPYAEYWLVHELCHCVLDGLSAREGVDVIEERAINRITRAMFKAYKLPQPPRDAI